jgi:hypothetical protein
MPFSSSSGEPPSPQAMRLVQLAMFAGVVLLGGVAYVLHAQGGGPLAPQLAGDATFRYALLAVVVLPVPAVLVLRRLARDAEGYDRRRGLTLAAWATAELSGLGGGIYYLLTGTPDLFALGVGLFAAVLYLVPPPQPEEAA